MKRRAHASSNPMKQVIVSLFTCAVLALIVCTEKASSSTNESSNHLLYPTLQTVFQPLQHTGPIEDATCDVEQLEEANDSQLHSILDELKNTTFFRNFAVDLDARCPLTISWAKKVKVISDNVDSPTIEVTTTILPLQKDEPDDEAQCASTGLVDLDPYAEPACGVAEDVEDVMPWQMGGGALSSWSHNAPTSISPNKREEDSTVLIEVKKSIPPNLGPASSLSSNIEEDEDLEGEFECTGGANGEELDSPPLCELSGSDFEDYFDDNKGDSSIRNLISSTLNAINKRMGWESESQKRTFSWKSFSDPVIVQDLNDGEPCDDDGDVRTGRVKSANRNLLPDTFWLDMCSNIKAGDGLKMVNLALNPERNTGYNGTHIWNAIYKENCIFVDGIANEPMCYEERVLYRLLSGLHTSTTLSIAKNYYPPSKRKSRETWESNPQYFMEKFGNNPEYIRNLHFSYVVLLRALRKASPFLHNYEIRTGNIVDDETASILLKRLLDSTILRSCNSVFTAFDESLMFQEAEAQRGSSQRMVSIQENFKEVFHNISSILDCVQCQQCKLHGKMAMLGYGTALKILFLPREELIASSLSRNEIVALVNTIAKFSESLKEVRELTALYWDNRQDKEKERPKALPILDNMPVEDPVDAAVGAVAALARNDMIVWEREAELVKMALSRHSELLILAKYYASDLNKFLFLSQSIGSNSSTVSDTSAEPDAIVVGSGLAGLATALNILDRGGSVIIIEKEHLLGGNSNKASSGINACCPNNETTTDYLDSFRNDTIRSAGEGAQLPLIETLVGKSAEAVTWLKERVGVDLSLLSQLGGHAHKRTHRPSDGMAGAEIMYGMQKAVKAYEKSGMVKILVDTSVTKLIKEDDGSVVGVEVKYLATGKKSSDRPTVIKSPNVVLATGGFAADRSSQSYLAKYRPELLKMPATAGEFSTGDGIGLATALGAGTVDMDKVQVHPTGWVDPAEPTNPNKILAAELMRGIGGILINSSGYRFCNELGNRAYVTDMMLGHNPYYAQTKKWDATSDIPTFSLVLSSSAAEDGKKHVNLYTHKGLMTKLEGVTALADWIGVDKNIVRSTLTQYQLSAEKGIDEWGKSSFRGVPQENLDDEVFYAGTVTPVLHYCMGGLTIDKEGNVLDEHKDIIPGLHAAGEVAGGVHGDNRLGGNSLLECTVYGTIVGQKIPIKQQAFFSKLPALMEKEIYEAKSRDVRMDELARHNTPEDCWVAIHGQVYDLTDFAEEHPAGAESIYRLAGLDGTDAFQAVHNAGLLDDFEEEKIGRLI